MIWLVEDWRKAWRWWSVRYAALVAILPEMLYRLAEASEHILPTLSYAVLDNLPWWLRSGAAIMAFVAVFLRLLRQPVKQ